MPRDIQPAQRVNQHAPQDRREAHREAAHDGEQREEMVAAHHGDDGHRQPHVRHVDQRGGQAHEELQREQDGNCWLQRTARQRQPARHDDRPRRHAEHHHGPAAEAVEARPQQPQAAQATEIRRRDHQQHVALAQAGLRLEPGDGERAQPAHRERPRHICTQQFPKRRVLRYRQPRDGLAALAARLHRRLDIGDALEEDEAQAAHRRAEDEERGELPGRRLLAQRERRQHDDQEAGEVHARRVAREVSAADIFRHERGDPRQPRAARNAAREVEREEQQQHERKPRRRIQHAGQQRHHRQPADEEHAHSPARIHEALVADMADVAGRRDLEDDQQRHHARDDAQHGGARPERLGVENHRAADDDGEGQRVERGEPIGVVQPRREAGWGGDVGGGGAHRRGIGRQGGGGDKYSVSRVQCSVSNSAPRLSAAPGAFAHCPRSAAFTPQKAASERSAPANTRRSCATNPAAA